MGLINEVDLKVGYTAERARINLKAIDDLTLRTTTDVAELQKELGSKGRIETIEAKLGSTYDAAMAALEKQRLEVVAKIGMIDGKIVDFESAAIESERKVNTVREDLEKRTHLLEGAVNGSYATAQQATSSAGTSSGEGSNFSRTMCQGNPLEKIGISMELILSHLSSNGGANS